MLKQLRFAKELELKRSKMASYQEREAEFEKKAAELERAIEEAETEEDIELVDENVSKLDKEKAELEKEKAELEAAIAELEKELEALKEDAPKQQEETQLPKPTQEKSEGEMRHMNTYFELREVKDFYESFKGLNQRSVTGGALTVPQEVLNRVMDLVNDYTTVYPLVDKIQVKGTARILIDTDEDGATWVEMNAAIPQGNTGTIKNVDFDGYKVAKLCTVDNALLQDSIINLDAYITRKMAKAIAKSLDAAILNGKGSSAKQPEGIITALKGENKVTVTSPTHLSQVVAPIGKVDTGKDGVGEIVAVMSRQTYYNSILALNVGMDSKGVVVGQVPNLANPTILGLKVVFSAHMAENEILFGDFSKYTIVEREDITVESSEHAGFGNDVMTFRAKGRFDGKPTNKDAFVLVTLSK